MAEPFFVTKRIAITMLDNENDFIDIEDYEMKVVPILNKKIIKFGDSKHMGAETTGYFIRAIPPSGYANLGDLIMVKEKNKIKIDTDNGITFPFNIQNIQVPTNSTDKKHVDLVENIITVIFAKINDEIVKAPIDFEKIWDSYNAKGKKISIWRPIPPTGYVALGDVLNNSYEKPLLTSVMCVNKNYVKLYEEKNYPIWNDVGSETEKHISTWKSNEYHTFISGFGEEPYKICPNTVKYSIIKSFIGMEPIIYKTKPIAVPKIETFEFETINKTLNKISPLTYILLFIITSIIMLDMTLKN